jgi:hypothetical protein
MKVKMNNRIQVIDMNKLDKISQSIMFNLSCINCIKYNICLKSKKKRGQCIVNDEITDILPDYKFCAKIETDSTKLFVDMIHDNDAENTKDTLKEISQNYTNNEIITFNVPRPRIPYKDIKQNGRR